MNVSLIWFIVQWTTELRGDPPPPSPPPNATNNLSDTNVNEGDIRRTVEAEYRF